MFTFFARRNLKVKIKEAMDHIIKQHVKKPLFWSKSMFLKELERNEIEQLIFKAIWTPTYEIGIEKSINPNNQELEDVVYRIYKT